MKINLVEDWEKHKLHEVTKTFLEGELGKRKTGHIFEAFEAVLRKKQTEINEQIDREYIKKPDYEDLKRKAYKFWGTLPQKQFEKIWDELRLDEFYKE